MASTALIGLAPERMAYAAVPAAQAFEPFAVKDIRIEGIQRTEAGTVFSYLPVKVGETMTDEKAAQAIRALFATGFFRDVRLEVEGQVLVVVVEERPAVSACWRATTRRLPATWAWASWASRSSTGKGISSRP